MRAAFPLIFLASVPFAHASQTVGGISSSHKFAWSDVGGWVNFAPSNSTVTVTDAGLTGYAWSANTGWINLAPSLGGVKNDGNGTLSGFAWDTGEGWISFTGVSIDGNGVFHGTATGANENIKFDCSTCSVQTDWRPASFRAAPISPGAISPVPLSTPSADTTSTEPAPPVSPPAPPTPPSYASNPTSAPRSSGSGPARGVVQSGWPSAFPSQVSTASRQRAAGNSTGTDHASTTSPVRNFTRLRSLVIVITGGTSILLILFFVLRFFI